MVHLSMEINGYNLSLSGRNHKQSTKFSPLDMLKENENLAHMEQPVPSKQREFIDHTLLAPEYLRDSNHFIMDLIDQQVVLQKPSIADSSFGGKDHVLNSDLQFQNAIFQFVNKHGQMHCAIADDGVALVENDVAVSNQPFNSKVEANFLGLNESFLSDPASNKNFDLNGPSDNSVNNQFGPLINNSLASICDLSEQTKTSDSELCLLGEEASSNSNLILNSNQLYAASNSKKVLPHKKRISRKLKAPDNKSDFPFGSGGLSDQSDKGQVVLIKQQKQTLILYHCELCGHVVSSQLDFFTHLKQHYEPKSVTTNLVADQKVSNTVKQQKHFNPKTRIQGKKVRQRNATQVFPDVHMNFEDLHPVHSSEDRVINQARKIADKKLLKLNSNSIEKCIHLVTQSEIAPRKLMSTEEIEFSDTEDMLEGIRNVVDKVSIEDTSDAVDMVTSNTIRTTWFENNDYGDTALNSKFVENDNYSTSVTAQFAFQKISLSNLDELKASCGSASEKLSCISVDKDNDCASDSYPDCEKTNSIDTEDFQASECGTKELELFDHMSEYEYGAIKKLQEGNEKKQKYLCAQCNREFNSNNALKYHKRTHTGVRPHQCDVCGRAFFAQGALKTHMRTHTGDKPFACEHCNQNFRQMGDLKYHIASKHNTNKSYQCEFCGKSFSRKYSLVLHRRIHTSERNYKCDFCPMSFRASIYLQNHRKIHTGEKPYHCDTCSKKFRVSGDLKRHQLTHKNRTKKNANSAHNQSS